MIYSGPDSSYTGREICFASNEDTVTIIDVTNKNNPQMLSREGYGNAQYTHQGWLTEDQEYFIFNDELDEYYGSPKTRTHVMKVTSLTNPTYEGFHAGRTAAIDHNLYVLGDLVYQANYRAGMNVLKIGNLDDADFAEIGYFDIFPSSDSNSFNAAWSTYPYYPSGNVVVSGIEQGLFVLKFVLPEPTLSPAPSSAPTSCDGDDISITILTDNWPFETGWSLVDDCTGDTLASKEPGSYTSTATEYVEDYCFSTSDTIYSFTITDTWGEGICCGYGDGSYEVTLNGELVASGGEFGSSETTTFGADDCDGPSPNCADAVTPIASLGNLYTCSQVVVGEACSLAATHCPLGCDECAAYACEDSEVPWSVLGGIFNCGQLAAQEPSDIEFYCSEFDLDTTCRSTCGWCS